MIFIYLGLEGNLYNRVFIVQFIITFRMKCTQSDILNDKVYEKR